MALAEAQPIHEQDVGVPLRAGGEHGVVRVLPAPWNFRVHEDDARHVFEQLHHRFELLIAQRPRRGSSLPVAFASSTWGTLPSFVSRVYPGTKKRYGYNGNSFICAVEFGKRIKAKSLLTGGESGNPDSKHFTDQALMYTKGQFKDVLFYKEDVLKHAERTYHPGE